MPVYYFIGIIVIVYGIRFALKGPGLRSMPRTMVGAAMCLVGIAQFFREIRPVGVALSAAGVVLFVAALIMMRGQIKRGGGPRLGGP